MAIRSLWADAGTAGLAIGVVAMLSAGISPLDTGYPAFDPAALVGQLLALDPAGFLWLGLLLVLATPVIRVVGALVGYVGRGERSMAMVAAGVLAVIGVGIALGVAMGVVAG